MKYQTKHQGPWFDIDAGERLDIKVCEWRFQRPEVNIAKCCHCGSCELFCPTGCINKNKHSFEPDLEYCKGCGLCARVCPTRSVKMVSEENE